MPSVYVAERYVNCGNPSCRKGCYENGAKTSTKPHGPYVNALIILGKSESLENLDMLRQVMERIGATGVKFSEKKDGRGLIAIPFPSGTDTEGLKEEIRDLLVENDGILTRTSE